MRLIDVNEAKKFLKENLMLPEKEFIDGRRYRIVVREVEMDER